MSERQEIRPSAVEPWREAWDALELPPPSGAPPGFATRVVARARAERAPRLGLPWSPAWSRLAAALALALGIAGGAGLGWMTAASDEPAGGDSWTASSLAEDFVDGAVSAIDSTAAETP